MICTLGRRNNYYKPAKVFFGYARLYQSCCRANGACISITQRKCQFSNIFVVLADIALQERDYPRLWLAGKVAVEQMYSKSAKLAAY